MLVIWLQAQPRRTAVRWLLARRWLGNQHVVEITDALALVAAEDVQFKASLEEAGKDAETK